MFEDSFGMDPDESTVKVRCYYEYAYSIRPTERTAVRVDATHLPHMDVRAVVAQDLSS